MVSVAGIVDREIVVAAQQLLEEENFIVEIGPHSFGINHLFSGTDTERAADLQIALDNPEVKAVFFNRGGYGSLRVLALIDWSGFFQNPKWLVGFSDITVFHSFLSQRDIASIHGVMPAFYFESGIRTGSLELLLGLIRGQSLSYSLPCHSQNRIGKACGKLVGGNLSLLISMRGTMLDQEVAGCVLFIEDIDEFDYHVDRMMMNLKFGGVLSKISGLIVGYFTNTKSGSTPFGSNALEIIEEAVSGYGYPVVYGFPAGHELPNLPLVMGAKVVLEVSGDGVRISQTF